MAVVKNEESGKFDFVCELKGCGDEGVPFTSSGWDSKKQAAARGAEHVNEHETGQPMTELVEFELSNGFKRSE